jgi:lysophospholipase L1-like esterase
VKKRILASLVVLCLAVLVAASVYVAQDRKFDSLPNAAQSAALESNIDITQEAFKIAVIGDSWVSGHNLDASIHDALAENGIESEVISFGNPGAKSRQIYRDLDANDAVLLDNSIRYVVIVAGVNDAAGHIGSDFYAHHMMNIISLLINHDKTPVIVELPEFDIAAASDISSTIKAFAYKILFDGGKTDIIQEYRNDLKNNIIKANAPCIVIPFDPIISDYSQSKNLYANSSHLNTDGYTLLGTHIGQSIAAEHSSIR